MDDPHYERQLQRVAVWEAWWRQRRQAEKTGPGGESATAVLLSLSREYQRRIKMAKAKLMGTLFDPDLERVNARRREALKTVPRTFWRDSAADHDLIWWTRKHQHLELQINLSLDAGATPAQVLQHYARASETFCKCAEPVLLQDRLIATGHKADVWPMLAGLASAQLPIRGDRIKLLKSLQELYWQEHPRDVYPSPWQLRPLLREQALLAVPSLLPFEPLGEAHAKYVRWNLLLLLTADKGLDQNDPRHVSLVAEIKAYRKKYREARALAKEKPNLTPYLRLGDVKTSEALLKLPDGVDGAVQALDVKRRKSGAAWMQTFTSDGLQHDLASGAGSALHPARNDDFRAVEERDALRTVLETAKLRGNERQIAERLLADPSLNDRDEIGRLARSVSRSKGQVSVEKHGALRKLRQAAEKLGDEKIA